ncbi:MAG TPA: methyltransferase domain-containing protein [Microlunatus sp.]
MALNTALDLLVCPLCRQSLADHGDSVRCGSGHAFDVARQGYLNLSGGPPPANADTAEMVAARAGFLDAGHYEAIADGLVGAVPSAARTVLDCGAGTGYYAARLLAADHDRRALALDVSVAAIRRAARAHERMAAVVADAWRPLPIADGVVDVIVSVFAPRNPAEFHRVLAPGGSLITVVPWPEHLVELRRPLGLLDVEPAKTDRLDTSLAGFFRRVATHPVRFRSSWDIVTARAAVLMGPNAFHVTPAELDRRLTRLSWPLEVTVSCLIGVWSRLTPCGS